MPGKLAIDDGRTRLTWRQLWDAVELRAHYLMRQIGADEPRIIALLMPNSSEYVISYLTIVHAGHMALPIDIIFKQLEVDAVISQTRPDLIITDKNNLKRLSLKRTPVLTYDKLITSKEITDPIRQPVEQQIASLFFTSGTTGEPKLAPNTHANHIWNIQTCSEAWGWNGSDSLLVNVRLSHMLGLVMGLSGALYHGNTLYLQDRFDPRQTLEFLSSGEVTQFSHGPLAYMRLLEASKGQQYDLSKVKLFISGSAPLPPATWHEFKERFGIEILEVYGTTETGRIASNLKNERLPGSPGRPLSGVRVKISGQNEVLIKSPGVFPGYYQNPTASEAATAPGGWWRTGDTGELKDGRLVLKGRLQEKIRKSGYTISPRDIEWALHKLPGVKEVFVMGLQRRGEVNDELIYYIVGSVSEDEVRSYCQANLPSVWRPDKIVMLDEIPRTRNGKPQLIALKSLAEKGAAV
jgi:malonyl-CoA/methylmalonyl-CoA synthetase